MRHSEERKAAKRKAWALLAVVVVGADPDINLEREEKKLQPYIQIDSVNLRANKQIGPFTLARPSHSHFT